MGSESFFTLPSIIGIILLAFGVPFVTILLFAFPKIKSAMIFLMIFFIPIIRKPYYHDIFYQDYRGIDRGFTVAISDLIFLGFFFFILLGGLKRKTLIMPKALPLWFMVILISAISVFQAQGPMLLGSFGLYTLFRTSILFWVIANLAQDKNNIKTIIYSFIITIIYQGGVVIWDKYIVQTVVSRSKGTFRHPNTLAMYFNALLPTIVVLFLNKQLGKKKNYAFALLAITLGFVGVLFTKSRAATIMLPSVLFFLSVFVTITRPDARKMLLLVSGIMMFSILGALALPRLIKRFESAPEQSKLTRIYFNDTAKKIANDNFFGCGMNLFPWTTEHTDYYWDVYPDRLDERDPQAFRDSAEGRSRLGVVHNIYLLTAAETGWIGLGVFLLFLLRLILLNISLLFKLKDFYYKSIALGILAGTFAFHAQGLLEFIFRTNSGLYLFMVLSGLLVGMEKADKLKTSR